MESNAVISFVKPWQISFSLPQKLFEEVDHIFGIRREFYVLGWALMLDFTGWYYPCLVGEFYANIEDKDDAGVH